MQTLERTQIDEPVPVHKRHRLALASTLLVILVVTAIASYAIASSRTGTKTVVRTVPAKISPVPAGVDDRGFSKLDNGHQARSGGFYQPLDSATRLLLQHQLTLAREVAMRYPTVKDVEAAGWHRAGPFSPGLGAHYFDWKHIASVLIPGGALTDNAVLHPVSLIYDGTHPDSRIAGLMYYSVGFPEGFAGGNDIWHFHTNVCIVYGAGGTIDTPFGADTTATSAMCNGVHGQLLRRTQWMLHAWVVPGYDSPQGVFSHDNAALTCRDGSYNTIPLDKIGNRSSVCVDGGE